MLAEAPSPLNPGAAGDFTGTVMVLLNGYAHIFLIAFIVTLLTTPLARRLAEWAGVVDRPDKTRKMHEYTVAYFGGLAVFAGILAAIGVSYFSVEDVPTSFLPVPMAVIIGMLAITYTGLADDIWGWDPRLKIAGQLVAAAALAIENVGDRVAQGLLSPIAPILDPILGTTMLRFEIHTPWGMIPIDTVYWVGTAIIAIFVLGGSNSANLIDGLDGLLSGVVAIVMLGLLMISLLMVPDLNADAVASGQGTMAGARIVLCLAVFGSVLGFLPYNFRPATIFLGDSGSLLLGYMCAVIILMFGERGQTHLVFAGLIVYSIPIIDTTLAIIRRKMAGISMSAADDQHLHHQLKRALGGVRSAVFALYAMETVFALVGVVLAALVLRTGLRVRVIYVIAFVLFSFIGVIAVKAARRQQRLKAVELKIAMKASSTPAISAQTDDTENNPHSAAPVSSTR
ncbi:MAG TPA: MraY family glycosyltransferase [Phycisphaerales bacterium]|nr:MraY family glycosyltransferase [Phycisphaerales bacterium]